MSLIAWTTLIISFILFLLSSFLSATETSITAFSRSRISRLAKKGDPKARLIQKLMKNVNHVIGTILIGNNALNNIATSLITSVFIQIFSETGIVVAVGVSTLFTIIFFEVMPKMYAIQQPEKVVLSMSPFIYIVIKILSPLMHLVQFISEKTLFILGVKVDDGENWSPALEELRSAIDLHGQEKLENESLMLHSILDLARVTVNKIMVHRSDVEMINISLPLQSIYEQIVKSSHSRLPLWKGSPENIVGIIHIKTFLKEFTQRLDPTFHKDSDSDKVLPSYNILDSSTFPWFVPESTTLLRQMQSFRLKRNHLAIVIDEYGSFSGIVTLEDILEEIVGQIDDEYDTQLLEFTPIKENTYNLKGTITLRDINREFNLEIPDTHASTLGGLLIYESRDIPAVGQTFKFYNIIFRVLAREDHEISMVQVVLPSPKSTVNS